MWRSYCVALALALRLQAVLSQVNSRGVQRVSECLMKGSGSSLSYPPWKQLEQHYADLMDATEKYRRLPVHSKPDYNGMWIENHFIATFKDRPLSAFGGLVPLFVQWVDYALVLKDGNLRCGLQLYRAHSCSSHFQFIHRERHNITKVQYEPGHPLYAYEQPPLPPSPSCLTPPSSCRHGTFRDFYDLLRRDVLYFTVSQDNHGITALSRRFRNILVFSAGGEGHVPLPLIKGDNAYVDYKAVYPKRDSIAFLGSVNHGAPQFAS